MPLLVGPALATGTLRSIGQPRIPVDDRLTLRPWCATDIPAVRAAFRSPDIQRWHLRRLDSDEEARGWIAGWSDRWRHETDASWAIADRRTDQALGQVGLRAVRLFDAIAQLSYWVLPDARRRGAAAGAVRALTGWAFDTLGLYRLYLKHSTANEGSCRVAERSGYRLEGTLRGHLRHADGWHDTHVHGRLRTEPLSP